MALPVDSTAGSLLLGALASNASRAQIDKASISNTVAGQTHSLWRATGQPAQGGIPTTAARCTNATVGAMGFTQQTAPVTTYLGWSNMVCSNTAPTVELHDRLMHMGGLSGTSVAAQTVDLDLHANIASDNLAARIGDSNYSDVSWWAEWYTDTGSTVATLTVNVTYNDGSSGNLTAVSLAATRRASFMQSLNVLNPTSGLFIRDINTATLSISTGTIGNFGFTCTRHRTTFDAILANKGEPMSWADMGVPEIYNSSCLQLIMICSTTTTGTVRGQLKMAHV